jgi:hypothetical protein
LQQRFAEIVVRADVARLEVDGRAQNARRIAGATHLEPGRCQAPLRRRVERAQRRQSFESIRGASQLAIGEQYLAEQRQRIRIVGCQCQYGVAEACGLGRASASIKFDCPGQGIHTQTLAGGRGGSPRRCVQKATLHKCHTNVLHT